MPPSCRLPFRLLSLRPRLKEAGGAPADECGAVPTVGVSPVEATPTTAAAGIRRSLMFAGKAGTVPCRYLLDSGAEAMCVSAAFVARHGLITQPAAEKVEIQLPDGSVHVADQELVLCVRLGAYTNAGWRFKVVPLAGEYDAVLGMPFLHLHNPQIDWRRRVMTVPCRLGRLRIHAEGGEDPCPFLLSSAALHTLLASKRSRAALHEYAWLVRLQAVDPSDAAACAAAASEAAQHLATQLQAEYADVLQEKLPQGLPPQRAVEMEINTEPGAAPPALRGTGCMLVS